MIINAVRAFLLSCPLLAEGRINVNFLGEKPIEYSIDNVPVNPIIQQYPDGSSLRQFVFVFASREWYDKAVIENIEITGFFEQFCEWLEQQNESNNLPVLGDTLMARSIQVLTAGYLYDNSIDTARYQVQLKLIYEKE